MTEYPLEPAGRTDLGDGYSLETISLQGAVREPDANAITRSFAEDLDGELERAGLRLERVLILPPTPAAGERGLVDDATPTATLNVPVRDDETCVLLVEDGATGALSWVLPDNFRDRAKGARARSFGTSLRFSIPLESVGPAAGTRGLISDAVALGKKVKAFFFKISDEIVGPIVHGVARRWEAKHRPAFTRTYGPQDYQIDDPKFPRLDAEGWQRLAGGRALLFVHGTFSTCGTFSALAPSMMEELARRYEGRVFAFNHPTLSADPRENAITFLRDIPDGVRLQLDIVCHSRGGLVARQIAALGEIEGSVDVRRIVFVGATNAGTALADSDHMIEMIDRFTTIAKFIPLGAARKAVDALVLVVKVLGHGLLSELEGLSAMNPGGAFLKALNVPGGRAIDYFAIASNFEPKEGTPFVSVRRAEDLAADRVFENAANDLVVPQDGVFAKNGAMGFPIAEARCLRFGPTDAVVHTEFFAEPRTGTTLLQWLELEAAPTRALVGRSRDEIARVLDAFRDQALAALTASDNARALRDAQPTLTPADLEALRPHVVNLSGGAFKESGNYSTSPADVDAIAHEHIPAWTASLPAGEPLRIVVWAHGGLVGERLGLQIAQKHVEWWKRNRVYPLYFVWETGLFDALRSILEAVARRIPGLGTRDLFDYSTDPLIQEGVRALGGVHVWGAMKTNAQLCSAANGGARYVAERLKEVANATPPGRTLELHAVGHSAGSIFHSWFLPMATQEIGLPGFSTLQLLAPAITIPDFSARLAQHLGPGHAAENTVMYTMRKSFEKDDSCIGIYRKSLLYLIHHALEPDRRTPILGLDLSVRADAATAKLFGLHGASKAPGRIVWSVTDAGDGKGSSKSKTHGGFDDDAPTMNSVAANILNAAQTPIPYPPPAASRAVDSWPIADEWLDGVDLSAMGAGLAVTGAAGSMTRPAPVTASVGPAPAQPQFAAKPAQPATGRGSRRAFCVGINEYPGRNRLQGCVQDTKTWGDALAALGFEVLDPLLDANATYQNILAGLQQLVTTAKRGDVLVFHYSGHGYTLPDTDGDEDDANEEVLVPIDFEAGGFLLDDDIRAVLEQLPQGVSLTAFIDCCHSGTITRVFGRSAEDEEDGARARYLKPEERENEWERAYVRFRERVRTTRGMQPQSRAVFGADAMRWVNFSACSPLEKALESDGNGHFTRIATGLITRGIEGFTHRSFQDAVLKAFGESRRQSPQLDCADDWRDLPLLQPLR